MGEGSEFESVKSLCMKLGSGEAQAETMARQLLKRADQVAEERSISRLEAMQELLEVLVMGRQGLVPERFSSKNSEKTDT
ncbi:MAG: hypothetical protein AAGB46_13875 [Verrucomicrobiota bacterium]